MADRDDPTVRIADWLARYGGDSVDLGAQRTAERFAARPGYYLTGDRARIEPDGQFRFAGRADDVITSSGYRIGPFEVEQALAGHPAVAESAVVGKRRTRSAARPSPRSWSSRPRPRRPTRWSRSCRPW